MKRLTAAQRHAQRMTIRGQEYYGGYVREDYIQYKKDCGKEEECEEKPKLRYLSSVQILLDAIEKANTPWHKKMKKKD